MNLCVLYLQKAVSPVSLQRIRERLKGIRCDHVLSIGALEQLLEDHPFSMLPQCVLTERPDRAASFLLEGQVVILMDGAPQALVMPVSFLHQFHTSEDTALRWPYGTFLRVIRLCGAALTLLLPGLFVALVLFHPAALPVALLTSILESQAAVPLSIPVETFMMLIMFNLINEAGHPGAGGGGHVPGHGKRAVLGQAAVEANLIHPLLIIVVAVSSLGSYALPDYELSLTFRMGQLLFLLAACLAGLYGMAALMLIVLVRLCALTSLGAPYLAPLAPRRPRNPDLLLRLPLWRQRLRAYLANRRTCAASPAGCGIGGGHERAVSNPHPGPFPLDGTGPAAGGRALLPAGGIAAVPAGNRPEPGGYRALCPNGGGRYLDDAPVHAAGTGAPGHRGPVQAFHRRPHPHRSLPGGAASPGGGTLAGICDPGAAVAGGGRAHGGGVSVHRGGGDEHRALWHGGGHGGHGPLLLSAQGPSPVRMAAALPSFGAAGAVVF